MPKHVAEILKIKKRRVFVVTERVSEFIQLPIRRNSEAREAAREPHARIIQV